MISTLKRLRWLDDGDAPVQFVMVGAVVDVDMNATNDTRSPNWSLVIDLGDEQRSVIIPAGLLAREVFLPHIGQSLRIVGRAMVPEQHGEIHLIATELRPFPVHEEATPHTEASHAGNR